MNIRQRARTACALLPAFLAASAFAQGRSCAQDKDEILASIQVMEGAARQRDAASIIGLMYPPVVRLMGNRQKAVADLQQSMDDLSQRLQIESSKAGEPGETLAGEQRRYCFVPVERVFVYDGTRVRSRAYLIAIFDAAEATVWTFLDGSALENRRASVWELLPDLPKDAKRPPVGDEPL